MSWNKRNNRNNMHGATIKKILLRCFWTNKTVHLLYFLAGKATPFKFCALHTTIYKTCIYSTTHHHFWRNDHFTGFVIYPHKNRTRLEITFIPTFRVTLLLTEQALISANTSDLYSEHQRSNPPLWHKLTWVRILEVFSDPPPKSLPAKFTIH
jgi:hypothetical protein